MSAISVAGIEYEEAKKRFKIASTITAAEFTFTDGRKLLKAVKNGDAWRITAVTDGARLMAVDATIHLRKLPAGTIFLSGDTPSI